MGLPQRTWFQKTAFVGAHVVACCLGYVLSIDPVFDYLRQQQQSIAARALAVQHASALIAQSESLSAVTAAELETASKRFVQGSSSSLIDADLLTRLRQAAADRGVSFRSVTTLPQREWSGRTFAGAHVEFSASTPQAADLLANVEDGPLLLVVHRARLSVPVDVNPSSDLIDVTLDIYGATQWSKD